MELGTSLEYVGAYEQKEIIETSCEEDSCLGMREVKLNHDVLVALKQMKELDLAKEGIFRQHGLKYWPQDAVTLVVQFSISRLDRFERTIAEWDGPISIAIYLTDEADIEILENYLQHGDNLEIYSQLSLTIVKPDYSIDEAALRARLRYPINRLRNLALQMAPTLFVLVTDADFIPSPNMHHLLRSKGVPLIKSPSLLTRSPTIHRTAIAVSAFVLSNDFNGSYPSTISQLSSLFYSNPPQATLTDVNAGHGPSMPSLLFESPSSTESWAYTICYEPQWEPYYLLHRPSHPLYDERFTDQGGDKQSHTLLLNALGFDFKVLREVWFLHPPKGIELEEWPSARLVSKEDEERGEEKVMIDPAHFSKAQLDTQRFRYFQDFLPEMEREWGMNVRWPRGCSAREVGGVSFGRARAGAVFGM